jgi:hypothetical protein
MGVQATFAPEDGALPAPDDPDFFSPAADFPDPPDPADPLDPPDSPDLADDSPDLPDEDGSPDFPEDSPDDPEVPLPESLEAEPFALAGLATSTAAFRLSVR